MLYELEEADRVQSIPGHASKAVADESYIHKQVKHQDKALKQAFRENSKNKRSFNRHFIILSARHKKTRFGGVIFFGSPNEIRTRVTAVKGRCPRPLDDGTIKICSILFASY